MKTTTLQAAGGVSLVLGSALLAAYSVLFSTVLPVGKAQTDFTRLVAHPAWMGIATVALAGVILMMFGFAAVYSRLHAEAGLTGLLGFLFTEVAYLLQACKVSWEIFLWPILLAHEGAAPLLRDRIIHQAHVVMAFRAIASATIFAGLLLFCLALVRSRVFPRSGGLLIFVGALLYGLGPLVGILPAIAGILILSAGCLVLGLTLVRARALATER